MNRFSADKHKYFRRSSDRFFFLFGLLMLCSEIWKQLTLTFLVGHGVYNLWYFPFQLCSIPMYVFLILPFARGENVRRALLCFIMCYALLGGTAVFADTSGLHYSYAPLTVHSYLWHFLMIGTAFFSGITCARELKSGQEKQAVPDLFPPNRFRGIRRSSRRLPAPPVRVCREHHALPDLLPDRHRN